MNRSTLTEFDTWQEVADALPDKEHTYDMSDDSHRLDIVQIVCETLAKLSES